jgi:ribonuclease Z
MRNIAKQIVFLLVSTFFLFSNLSAQTEFRVTLLGTGSPIPRIDRFGPATLIEVGGQELLFDVGRGATQRLMQVGISLSAIDAVFITHFHSDHVNGLPDLWMTGWLPAAWNYGGRSGLFEVWGPIGTKSMLDQLEIAFEADTNIRVMDQFLPPEGADTLAHEFNQDGIVYESNGVVVTAFAVNHGELIKPTYGYRIDYDGRSVVISGDTRYDENLIAAAQGADLVIHEVVLVSDALLSSSEQIQRIVDHHTTPEEAGTVFSQINPKLAVYSHLVNLSNQLIPEEPLESLLTRTRINYDGPLVIGEDLMSFIIDDNVTIFSRMP